MNRIVGKFSGETYTKFMYLWIEKDSENPDFIAILCFTKVYDIFSTIWIFQFIVNYFYVI